MICCYTVACSGCPFVCFKFEERTCQDWVATKSDTLIKNEQLTLVDQALPNCGVGRLGLFSGCSFWQISKSKVRSSCQSHSATTVEWVAKDNIMEWLLEIRLLSGRLFWLISKPTINSCRSHSAKTMEWVAKDFCWVVCFRKATKWQVALVITPCHNCAVGCQGLLAGCLFCQVDKKLLSTKLCQNCEMGWQRLSGCSFWQISKSTKDSCWSHSSTTVESVARDCYRVIRFDKSTSQL